MQGHLRAVPPEILHPTNLTCLTLAMALHPGLVHWLSGSGASHSMVVSGDSPFLHGSYLPRGRKIKLLGQEVSTHITGVVSLTPCSTGQSSHQLCSDSWVEKQTPPIEEGVKWSHCRRASVMQDIVAAIFGKHILPHLPL